MEMERMRVLRVSLFGFLVAFGLLYSVPQQQAAAAEPIRIGAIFSITGPLGFIGTPQRDAVIAMVEDVNKRGGLLGGRQVELLIEDDKTVATNAVIAVTKLARDKKVSAIVGPSATDCGMAIMPVADQENVPLLVTTPVAAAYRKWVFYLGDGDAREAAHFLQFAVKSLAAKRLALISTIDNHGSTMANSVLKEIANYPGSSIVIHEKCEPTDTNVVPQLTKIKAAKPDTLLVFMAGGTAAIVAKNCAQLGLTTQVVASHGVPMPDFVKLAGKIAEANKWIMFGNFMAVIDKYPADNPLKKNIYEPFRKVMQDKFGKDKEPNIFHAVTSDGIRAVLEAIKIAGSDDRAAIRDAIEKVRFDGFVGPFAPTATDHQGSPTSATVPTVLKNGEFWPWQK
jgi:branched-chain amino acid transport system substrate-binding protein